MAKQGFSIIELLTVIGIIVFIVAVSFLSLSSSRRKASFDHTKVRMVTLLGDAQSRSVNQENGLAWGVHFENSSTSPFYSLFSGTYMSAGERGHYALPSDIGYVSTSIAVGSSKEIMFEAVSGAASGTRSVAVQLLTSPFTSSTISVSSSGVVTY